MFETGLLLMAFHLRLLVEFVPVLAWGYLSSSGCNLYNREWACLGAVVKKLWDSERLGIDSLNCLS